MIASLSKSALAVALLSAVLPFVGTAAAATPPGFKSCGAHKLSRGSWGISAKPSFPCDKALAVVSSLESTKVPATYHFAANKAQKSAGVTCMGLYAAGKPPQTITCAKGSNPAFVAFHVGK
jgi:hypothetical protein